MLQQSDAAFIGTMVRVESFAGRHEFYDLVYTFRVEQAFKKDLGPVVRVLSGGSCGLYGLKGQQQAYVLYEYEPGLYSSESCSSADPVDLRTAARPLPAPDGKGPPAFLLGGAFGEVRTIALDASGRTLTYGRGEGETDELIRCPDDRRVVELVLPDDGDLLIGVRELPSLRTIDEIALPSELHGSRPLSLGCPDEEARDLLLFWSDLPYGKLGGSIWQRDGDAWRRIPVGKNVESGSFAGTTAYLTTLEPKPRLIQFDVSTQARRVIARVPPQIHAWVQSPDGRRIARIAAFDPQEFPKLVVVDVDSSSPSVFWRYVGQEMLIADIQWLENDRLALLGDATLRTYDASLRLLTEWKDWRSPFRAAAVVNARVFGLVDPPTRLASVRLSDGGNQRIIGRRLESGISSMLVLPEASARPPVHEVDGPRAATRKWSLTLVLAVVGVLLGMFFAMRRVARRPLR